MNSPRSEPLSLAGLPWPLELREHPSARRLRLSVDEARGLIRLTVPRRTSRRAALDWARRQASWVERQLASIAPAEPFIPGAAIPFDGAMLRLEWQARGPRAPALDDGALVVGGPEDRFAARVERWLRDTARRRLTEETRAIAAAGRIDDGPVAVGDAVTRWGSCSASGAIRYNWRLILAPPDVRRFVVAHEVAHRVHLDHGADFHALEERLYGGTVSAARSELRRLGARLKRVGRR